MIQFDCHAHVYEKITAVDNARYTPERPAPLSSWLSHQTHHGLGGGVIVQVSFLGADNSELCAALAKLDRKCFAGIAVVEMDARDETLDDLVKAGIRGVRWNLVRGAPLPDLAAPRTQTFFKKLRTRNLHLEVHLEGPRLAPLLAPLTDQGVNLVVDHFGLPTQPNPDTDPMIRAVAKLADLSNLFFKFSAHYRVPFDIRPHAQTLVSLLPSDHVVWGSDWPHTQNENQMTYDKAHQELQNWGNWSDEKAARTLYGIEAI